MEELGDCLEMQATNRVEKSQAIYEKRWMTTKEAAFYLGCSEIFLAKDRQTRLHGIPFSRLGGLIKYDRFCLDDFMNASRIGA